MAQSHSSGYDSSAYDIADEATVSGPRRYKALILSGIRFAHRIARSRPLEAKIALYFHQLDREHWSEFEQAARYFLERGYETVTPAQFASTGGPDRQLFISFDDNFKGWHEALPMFRELGITATFYANSMPFRDAASSKDIARYLRRLRMPANYETLTTDELRELHDQGHTIGCHSHSHFVLSQMPREFWDDEIAGCKSRLEDLIGAPVVDFSWPYGMRRHFCEPLRAYCKDIGFKTITNAIPGCQSIASQDPFDLYRTAWQFGTSLEANLENLRIDGRFYARWTGRSVLGA